ncbi:MAG: hypothetical protein V4599_12530 [Verrucomicrobiota bacterium]
MLVTPCVIVSEKGSTIESKNAPHRELGLIFSPPAMSAERKKQTLLELGWSRAFIVQEATQGIRL